MVATSSRFVLIPTTKSTDTAFFHADRLEGVIRGREKFKSNTHAGGLTNLEKERKKNFLMVRKGMAVKRKTRVGDKQVSATKRYMAKCYCWC